MGWVTLHAPGKGELDACVQCGLCLPYCPTFRLTGDEAASPRGRLTAMAAVQDGLAALDETFEEMMGFCLQCRACEAVCPSLVPFGRAMEGARAEVAAQRPSGARAVRHVALGRRGLGSRIAVRLATVAAALGQRLGAPRWLPGSLGAGLRGLRELPLLPRTVVGGRWPAPGRSRGRVALFAGCVMDPWFAPVHTATIAVLRQAGWDVEAPPAQTCCGALAAHDGAAAEADALAARNVEALAGYDLVVVDAAGCGAHLKDVGVDARDVTEVVAAAIDDGSLPAVPPKGRTVAIQDPCHLRHAQRVVAEPRAVLRASGYDVVEIDPAGLCCGAAGIYSLLRPDTSADLGRRKADQVRAASVRLVASANPGCEMQLRSHLGPGYRIAHPVELYAEAIGAV